MGKSAPAIERFMAKIEKSPDGCWLWTASVIPGGYASSWDDKTTHGHRWSYTHFIGPVPDGMHLDHLCRVKRCVNPEHLEPVTCRENLLRSDLTWAHRNATKSQCSKGHAYDETNTGVDSEGFRFCRQCRSEYQRNYYIRNKKGITT